MEPLVEIEHPSLLITAVSVQQETRTSELLKPLLQLAPAVVTRARSSKIQLKDLDLRLGSTESDWALVADTNNQASVALRGTP